jgi:hypothetical protein
VGRLTRCAAANSVSSASIAVLTRMRL